jgi:hypothetical protein
MTKYRTVVIIVTQNQRLPDLAVKFISFLNVGTTLVSLDGLILLPLEEKIYNIQGENACLEMSNQVTFGQKVEEPSFKTQEGTFLRVEYFECI